MVIYGKWFGGVAREVGRAEVQFGFQPGDGVQGPAVSGGVHLLLAVCYSLFFHCNLLPGGVE